MTKRDNSCYNKHLPAEGGCSVEQTRETPDLAGQKQVLRALQNGELSAVYLADDADERLRTAVLESAKRAETPVFRVETMKMLGAIAGIGVGAAAAGVKKTRNAADSGQSSLQGLQGAVRYI